MAFYASRREVAASALSHLIGDRRSQRLRRLRCTGLFFCKLLCLFVLASCAITLTRNAEGLDEAAQDANG